MVFLCFALKFWRVERLKMYVALPHDFGQSGTWFRVRVALGLGFKGNKFACQFMTFCLNETEGFSPPTIFINENHKFLNFMTCLGKK